MLMLPADAPFAAPLTAVCRGVVVPCHALRCHVLLPHRTAPHRTAPHRTAPHRTAQVFGGFAANELAVRIDDCAPKVVVSASCGLEGADRVIEYKPLLDAAIDLAAHKPASCIMCVGVVRAG